MAYLKTNYINHKKKSKKIFLQNLINKTFSLRVPYLFHEEEQQDQEYDLSKNLLQCGRRVIYFNAVCAE